MAVLSAIGSFIFLYPVAMSIVWVLGGWYFHSRRESDQAPRASGYPPITVLVPCHNEEKTIEATLNALKLADYPDYRVVFIDDASTDRTADVLRRGIAGLERFHLLRLRSNRGKSEAINCALRTAVTTPVTVVIDADTIIMQDTLKWLVAPFSIQPRLGAVTGNPIPHNRTNMLEMVQAGEFASIIGLIRRSQRVYGRIVTVSGCIAAYRTSLLREAGGFSSETATEDIDMTWKIQRRFYEVWYEPRAVVWIQVPSTLRQFWKQRVRWALGGWHTLRRHAGVWLDWRHRRMWLVYAEFATGYLWDFAFVSGILLWMLGSLFHWHIPGISPIPAWHGAILSLASVIQFAAALTANRRYDDTVIKALLWAPWYPLFFFVFGALTVVATTKKGLFGSMKQAGRWTSPTRESVPSDASDLAMVETSSSTQQG